MAAASDRRKVSFVHSSIEENGVEMRMFLHPPYIHGFSTPEVVKVGGNNGREVTDGPRDEQMEVYDVDENFILMRSTPGFEVLSRIPVDQFLFAAPGTRAFSCCQMYATVRRVMDIFEKYHGSPIKFGTDDDGILVLIPRVQKWAPNDRLIFGRFRIKGQVEPFNNAVSFSGPDEKLAFGFAAKGQSRSELDLNKPYCENFDVLAHEMGHTLVNALVGQVNHSEFGAFNESMGDFVAFVTVLHFDGFVQHVLQDTHGNLATKNHLTITGELSDTSSIRVALNQYTTSTVSSEEHDLSMPLTGALTDVFLSIYLKKLVSLEAITQSLADNAFNNRFASQPSSTVSNGFNQAFSRGVEVFEEAVITARDILGESITDVWKVFKSGANRFSFSNFSEEISRVSARKAVEQEVFSANSGAEQSFKLLFVDRGLIQQSSRAERLLNLDMRNVHVAFHKGQQPVEAEAICEE